ncbi:MAG: beta-ketoacyl-ACP synthase II [candidate division Zixibacteria bacterium]|nr:beta-ketoacyl-ACP synthase II [candidate division Zixibacteria bacterium]
MTLQRDSRQFVAVTGIGMICPLGVTTDECWENMLQGKSGIRRITRFDPSNCLTRIGGELPDRYYQFEKTAFSPRVYKRSVLPSRLSILSARQAIEDGGIELDSIDRNRVAVITGCGGSTFGDQMGIYEGRGRLSLTHEMLNALAACVSIDFGFKGPSFNVATACASGAFAIGLGYDYVRQGGDVCVAIGIDTMLLKETIDGFNQLMALSEENEYPERASRPFDKRRNGFVLSEGACAVLLESYEHARQRGARIYAVISGYAATSEGYNIIAPDPEGKEMARTMEMAIQRAGIPKKEIGYVNAHGTSTPHNDLAETRAIKMVFGSNAYGIPVSSQKSMIGHTIGAAGAIEFAVSALTLYHQVITPTINYEEPDPGCDLDYVPNEARRVQSLKAAVSNSFGFGGHNSTLVLERHERPLEGTIHRAFPLPNSRI